MHFFSSLSPDHLQRYSRIIQEGVAVRRHVDLLSWLQGEVQHYLPHEIMLAAWGDFDSNFVQYDVVSALPGVRTAHLLPAGLVPLLRGLYKQWIGMGKITCVPNSHPNLLCDSGIQCSFGRALQDMRSSLLHGISDERRHCDSIYVIFSSKDKLNSSTLSAMEILLPYLDTALRRVVPLPHHPRQFLPTRDSWESEGYGLSEREIEIMEWVKMGKTNAEIGSILCISSFTVKSHLQHIFKKLEVYNRMQAVSKIESSPSHG